MNQTPSLPRLRLISDDELEQEFTAGGHDETTRQAILFERLRRIAPAHATKSGNPGLLWAILVVSFIAAVLGGIGAYPVLSGAFDREWFDF